jgi:hypothetical protein
LMAGTSRRIPDDVGVRSPRRPYMERSKGLNKRTLVRTTSAVLRVTKVMFLTLAVIKASLVEAGAPKRAGPLRAAEIFNARFAGAGHPGADQHQGRKRA